MKVRWVSKQFSRFDLALTKLSRPLGIVNTISNLSVALVIGFFIFGLIFVFGFLALIVLGYALHRSGFFMETMNETFDQQQKQLYKRQIRFMAANISKCDRMSNEELETELERASVELRM